MKSVSRPQSKLKAKVAKKKLVQVDGLPDFESSETETEPESTLSHQ
jgi:hypothetical protein